MSLTLRHLVLGAAAAALLVASQAPPADALGLGARGAWVDRTDAEESSRMLGAFVRTGGMIGIEGAVDYRNEDLGSGAEMRTWPVTVSLIASPIPFLYGLAGVGWYNTTIEAPALLGSNEETSTDFGYHIGAGAQLPVMPALSLVGDVRYAYVDYEFEEFTGSASELEKGSSVSVNIGAMLQIPPTP
ncbi:MAG: outer membrane protein [Candidatus Eiseniibacteriota bacterium]